MGTRAPTTVAFSIRGPISRADLPGLCELVCALQGAHRIAGAEQPRFQVGIELRAPEADKRRAAANALAMDQPGQSFLADAVFTRNQYADRRSRRERDILPQFARSRTGSDENSCYFTRIEGA